MGEPQGVHNRGIQGPCVSCFLHLPRFPAPWLCFSVSLGRGTGAGNMAMCFTTQLFLPVAPFHFFHTLPLFHQVGDYSREYGSTFCVSRRIGELEDSRLGRGGQRKYES